MVSEGSLFTMEIGIRAVGMMINFMEKELTIGKMEGVIKEILLMDTFMEMLLEFMLLEMYM